MKSLQRLIQDEGQRRVNAFPGQLKSQALDLRALALDLLLQQVRLEFCDEQGFQRFQRR